MDHFSLRFVPSVPSTEPGRVEVMNFFFCSPDILGASLAKSLSYVQVREIQPLREEKKYN